MDAVSQSKSKDAKLLSSRSCLVDGKSTSRECDTGHEWVEPGIWRTQEMPVGIAYYGTCAYIVAVSRWPRYQLSCRLQRHPRRWTNWVAKRLIVKRVVKIRMAGAKRPRRQGALLIENCASAGGRSGEDLPTKQGTNRPPTHPPTHPIPPRH